MKLYSKKQRWKKFLILLGLAIIGVIFYFTSIVVDNLKTAELEKIHLWSEAIKKKAELVKLTNAAFEELAENERNEVKLWARATQELNNPLADFSLALEIIQNNNKIPLVLTDENGIYSSHKNFNFNNSISKLQLQSHIDSICEVWSKQNSPIVINYFEDKQQRIFYSNSKKYFQLQVLRDSLLLSFSNDIMNNIAQLPVMFWSIEGDSLIASNFVNPKIENDEFELIKYNMIQENEPVSISLGLENHGLVYYSNSNILFQLQYFPFFTLLIIALFLLISYLTFSSFRKAEQNQVWAGMAKETAHQLGTPLSSLQGWIEILKEEDIGELEAFSEMEKDINRLTMVSQRFSKIGSSIELQKTDLILFFNTYLEYMQKRIPKTIFINTYLGNEAIFVMLNTPLFSWVIENVMKNAADAMNGTGELKISLCKLNDNVQVLIEDNGKGIPSSIQKTVFEPGYTTKERGWGLGLSLSKRIVEGHHKGKIHVKQSKKDIGTIIEILIPNIK